MFCNWSGAWGWGMMGFGWLVGLAILGLVLWAVVGAVRGPGARPADDALRILDERLARGDIGPDDYAERRALLIGRR